VVAAARCVATLFRCLTCSDARPAVDAVEFVVRWEMVAILFIAMMIGASAVGVRALTANGPGGVGRASGGIVSATHSAKRANGAISFLKVCENDYERAYHRGHEPPASDRHLGRMAEAQVERWEAAENGTA
jgi:hypothetical protein